jgi:transcriptional regulator with XRE-family HTH domain
MAMTPLQRKAAFKAATTMQEVSMASAARRLGVSYNHLMLVLAGEREGSAALKRRIATFLGKNITEVFEAGQVGRDRR